MPDKSYFQTGWVVDDLDRAIERFLATTSAGPFFVMPHLELTVSHRGRPSDIDFSLAMAQMGGMQIELIEQHNDAGSAYRDSFPPGASGVHHICAITQDLDADFERFAGMGIEIAHQGTFGPMRFVYFDTRPTIGCMTELLETDAATGEMFTMVAAAGAEWDGTEPIRSM
jgi:hypothetical protein